MKGYKVFNPNWTTMNGFRWEVGKTYEHEGKLEICESGFHFCKNLADCFRYYGFDQTNKVAEIEALGKIEIEDFRGKCVTDKIKIVREIPWDEVLTLVNIGHENTGYKNSGDRNSGYRNSGDYNSGNVNTGDHNSGSYNTGDHNTGRYNTGDNNTGRYNAGHYNAGNYNTGNHNSGCWNTGKFNSGNWNSGSYNTGSYNTGYFNACNYSTGYFNTESSKVYMFNKPCDLTREKIHQLTGMHVLRSFRFTEFTEWIEAADMTDEEKLEHPEYTVTEGYLKCKDFKDAFKEFWCRINKHSRQAIQDLPNFDPEIFKKITGIDVTEDYTDNN